jgi:hypothetical protein
MLPRNITREEFNYLFIDHDYSLKCTVSNHNQDIPTTFEYEEHQVNIQNLSLL